MPHRVLKARLQVGPETFQDAPPNRRGAPRWGPVMVGRENLGMGSPSSRKE